jgi:hypothetical protein
MCWCSNNISIYIAFYKNAQLQLHYFCKQLGLILKKLPTSQTIITGEFIAPVSTNGLKQMTSINLKQPHYNSANTD